MRWPCLQMLCNTTPCRASVATNGLWRVAACAWHEPPADTCSVVSSSPSHARSIKIIIPDFPLFFMQFPAGHSRPHQHPPGSEFSPKLIVLDWICATNPVAYSRSVDCRLLGSISLFLDNPRVKNSSIKSIV